MPETARPKPTLEPQDNVLIITRRLFAGDNRRHFVGTVERYDAGVARVRGYAFVYDVQKGSFAKRKSQRTRVFPLDNHLVVFILPEADIGEVRYAADEDSNLVVTDGKNFKLQLDEFLD